jgi:streptogramin lyase
MVADYYLSSQSQPVEAAVGEDSDLWFTEFGANKIGRISLDGMLTECQIPTPSAHPFAITKGPDGNMWFTEGNPEKPALSGNHIGVITPAGDIREYKIPTSDSAAVGITSGPDGNLWFTEYNAGRIGRVTVKGKVTEFSLPHGGQPDQITAGPGGLWFTEFSGNRIGRITPTGSLTEYSTFSNGNPVGIASVDGELWFTEVSSNEIGRMNVNGQMISSILVPTREVPGAANLAADPHHAVWFTEAQSGLIGYIAGTKPFRISHEYRVAADGSLLIDITFGPDGKPWFTVQDAGVIGRITHL